MRRVSHGGSSSSSSEWNNILIRRYLIERMKGDELPKKKAGKPSSRD